VTATRLAVGGERPYEIVVGTGILPELASLIGSDAGNVVVIYSAAQDGLAAEVCQSLIRAGYAVHPETVPDGEAAKGR
jgi:3-dehydroquinate synthase